MARRQRSGRRSSSFGQYVPVHQRHARGEDAAARASAEDNPFEPVRGEGRNLVRSPWGMAWCRHIESFHDFLNRLPRGRTYLRNGSVIDLRIQPGEIHAIVSGSDLYRASVRIKRCSRARWQELVDRCSGKVSSLVELLEGRFSDAVMNEMIGVEDGLFPNFRQVDLNCTCPDWANLCKHLAAVLYGVGVRLDDKPELLFTLRGVDPSELIQIDSLALSADRPDELTGDLSAIFGVDIDPRDDLNAAHRAPKKRQSSPRGSTPKRGEKKPRRGPNAELDDALESHTSRSELIELGIPSGTIASWLSHGILEPTGIRGIYRHTPDSHQRLAHRRESTGGTNQSRHQDNER